MTMAALEHLGTGLVATALAWLRLASWSASGLLLGAARLRTGSATRLAVATLAGACLTMLIYAVLASTGSLAAAVALDAAIAVASLVARGASARNLLRTSGRLLLPSSRSGRVVLAAVLGVVWIVAIGPPRDGDVMHYHLAHIRQIIAAGVWRQIPICSYGIPFGWSLTYLPFEWAGLPQTAHLLNAGAWLLACALCIEGVKPAPDPAVTSPQVVTRWMLLCLTLLPAILKAATTAMADSFMILDVALVVALLMQWPRLGRSGFAALGFATFCGTTTRYQAAAVVIAVSVIVAVEGVRRREARTLSLPFLGGALVASVAAAPFYIANALTLGSPVWPFASSPGGGGQRFPASGMTDAAQQLAAMCSTRAVAGGVQTAAMAAARLFVDRSVFPIPALLAVGCLLALTSNLFGTRRIAGFILLFMLAWVAAQPTLAPRFSIYLVAAGVVCAAAPFSRLLATRAAPLMRIASAAALGVLAIVAAVYVRDYFMLAATGDVARFNRATWYWPAYDWANRETPPHARFVVALYGGDTYPLHRWNISADPRSSATLPWRSIRNGCDLHRFLLGAQADFLFYGPDVWTGRPMDPDVERVVGESIRMGALNSVRTFDVPIVYGRMEGLETQSHVTLYRVARTTTGPACEASAGSGSDH